MALAGHTGACARRRRSTRRQSHPTSASAPLSSWTPEASRSVPHSSSSELGRAQAGRTEQGRRRSSRRPRLAAPLRFIALQPTTPRPEARPSLHERGRALPGRNRAQTAARHCRPPSSSAPSFAPHDDDPLPAFLRAKSIHGEPGRNPSSLPDPLPIRIRSAPPSNRCRAAAERAVRRPRRRRLSLGAAPRRCRAP